MSRRGSPWVAAAAALERARRARLVGESGPWLRPAALRLLRRLDPDEQGAGIASCRAVLLHAERLDAALEAFDRIRVPWTGDRLLGPAEAVATLVDEPERSSRAELADALARLAAPPALELASSYAAVVERSAEEGAVALVSAAGIDDADRLLRLTKDAVADVLGWARHGLDGPFSMRSTTAGWQDVVRVIANPRSKGLLRAGDDPWRALATWRMSWGIGAEGADARAEFELTSGRSAGFGSWAVPIGGRAAVGAAGWTASLRWRFCLEALGRWDALRESGVTVLLPEDRGAASLWSVLYPMLLTEAPFLQRVAHATADDDGPRWLALSELLLARVDAASVRVQAVFQQGRSVAEAREAAAQEFPQALFADVPPDLGLLLCRPFALTSSARALFAASALIQRQREAFDVDWWRNPRSVQPARELMARSANATLEELVPEVKAEAALTVWINATLGA